MSEYQSIKAELEKKLNQLVVRVEGIDADLSEATDDDWEERATEVEDDDVLSSVGRSSAKEIEQIKFALHLIESGKYGTCTRCGKKIPQARLEAVPYAVTCTTCS